MNWLTAVVACAAVLLLSKLEGFDCDTNCDTLILPESKYPSTSDEFHLSPSEIALLSSKVSAAAVQPSPQSSPTTLALINAISTSPYLLSYLPPPLVFNFLSELTSSPVNLHSVEPSTVASLIHSLCSSTSLFKVAPIRALVDFVTAIAVSPEILSAVPPSTIVRLLNKIHGETPGVLCALSPAVRVSLISCLLSPGVLGSLKPTDVLFLVRMFLDTGRVLAELPFSGVVELLKTISSSPVLLGNIPTCLIVDLLHRISELASSLFCAIPLDVTNALLGPIITAVPGQSPTTLLRLTAVVTSSPYIFNILDPSILSSLLIALSQPETLSAVPPAVLVKLLTDLSNRLSKNIKAEAIVGILHGIASASPDLLCDLPCSARSVYVTSLTSREVTDTLSHQTSVKLIDILCNTPCFLAELPPSSVNRIIAFVVSDEELLRAVPPENIVGLIFNITVLSPSMLRETRPGDIGKLLSPLYTTSALSALRPSCFEKLLSSIACSPFLTRAIPAAQIVNILTMLNSSRDTIKEIPYSVYVNMLTHIFTTAELLSEIPFVLLLNLLVKIESDCAPGVVCAIPPAAISAFFDYLTEKPAALRSCAPTDMRNIVYLLAKCPYFLTQTSTATLNVLLESIAALSAVANAVPTEIFVELVDSVCSLSPSIFCSLSPRAIRAITNSFDSLDTLSGLSSKTIVELTTAVSGCPCLLSALDRRTVANLLDALSASPGALRLLRPDVVVNLIALISSGDGPTTTVPAYPLIRFLRALSLVSPSALCAIPTSVYTVLLNPLKSLNAVNDLTYTGVENLIDVLIATPCLLGALPRPILANTIVAITHTFTALPYAKIIALLTAVHSVSPSLMCIVPDDVLTELLAIFAVQSELSALPSEFLTAFVGLASSSPCLLDLMPAPALESLLKHLSSSPRLLKDVLPSDVLENFLIKLSLTRSRLRDVRLSLIVQLLSALFPAPGRSTCALQPMVVHALLAPLCDDQTVFELGPADVATLLDVASSVPCVLNAIAGTTLDTLISKVASSSHLVTNISPSLLTSFIGAVTSSQTALNAVRPLTIVHLLTTVAMRQPSVLSSLPPRVATALLDAFRSPETFAALPPPVVNNFINLLMTFPNILVALPLSTLNALLGFLSSSPTAIGLLPSCTLVRFLTVLSSLPPLLDALPPGLLVSFVSAVSAASPKFLCVLPPAVPIALLKSVTSDAALASSTPATIASLISTLNRSSCLIHVVPTPVLVSLLAFLAGHQHLLRETSRCDLVAFVNNVQSPGTVPRVCPAGAHPACPTSNHFEDFSSFKIRSPAVNADNAANATAKCLNHNDNTATKVFPNTQIPGTAAPKYEAGPTHTGRDDGPHASATDNPKNNDRLFDLIPKLILPETANEATVYVFPKRKTRSISNTNTTA
ncbi:Hypothetical protein CINCED_3A017725 [Cinara cedri]|uniref:Uncharacterized protein n=1 Tax=Cinara cedri TaxID=506608 RepID=A0A5E4M073_9HEMI|nr:Hypothetical protein CINCED_3A017725 [Cinara cedri]